jgi:hypothetical protein
VATGVYLYLVYLDCYFMLIVWGESEGDIYVGVGNHSYQALQWDTLD